MKTKLFFAAMAAVAIVGCNKEVAETPAIADGEASFLSVNLKAAGTITRAAEPGTFVFGEEHENSVETIHFYFFDAEGNAYAVQAGSNNIAWYEGDKEEDPNVEEISDLVLVIKKSKDVPPAKMVVVLNAPKDLQVNSISLSELEEAVTTNLTNESGDFVMTNSVYADGLNNVINATEISGDNFFTTTDELKDVNPGDVFYADEVSTLPIKINPVEVYVERVAAKVDVELAEDGLYDTGAEINGEKVYAKVLGWDITNTTDQAYVLKQINPTWGEELGFEPWNIPGLYRSYWANTTATPKHGKTFEALIGANLETPYNYYFENTLPAGDGVNVVDGTSAEGHNQTPQLLVAAQLVTVDVDGDTEPVEFAKWYDVVYSVEGVEKAMLNSVASKLYKKVSVTTGEEGETETRYEKIDLDDVVLYQVDEKTADNRYEVKLMLAEENEYYSPAEASVNGEPYTAEEVKALLESVSPAQVWKDGHSYYYTNINHFGTATGMVRNHVYKVNIEAMHGLGTPVFEDGHIITPEKPEKQEALNIAAKINILSWHVVSQNVSLGE